MDAGQPAELARRFGALFVDWIACLLISRLFADPVTQPWAPPAVLVAEYTIFLGFFTYTPGMFLLRIRCVRYGVGGVIGVPRALLRALLLVLLVRALIMDSQRRGLHDKAAGSFVVAAESSGS